MGRLLPVRFRAPGVGKQTFGRNNGGHAVADISVIREQSPRFAYRPFAHASAEASSLDVMVEELCLAASGPNSREANVRRLRSLGIAKGSARIPWAQA